MGLGNYIRSINIGKKLAQELDIILCLKGHFKSLRKIKIPFNYFFWEDTNKLNQIIKNNSPVGIFIDLYGGHYFINPFLINDILKNLKYPKDCNLHLFGDLRYLTCLDQS